MILNIVNKAFTWIIVIVLLITMQQRKSRNSDKKRLAVLLLATDVFVLYIFLALRDHYGMPEWVDWILLLAAFIVPVIFRKNLFPFALHCRECGKKLSWNEIIGEDDNICKECYMKKNPDEKKKEEIEKLTREDQIAIRCQEANSVDEVPWGSWEPTERCTLTYLFRDDEVLLIEKKRGMGTGYYNAPGGHIELEETKYEAAVREAKEETGLDMSELEEVGTLYFQFKDGIRMIGYVFFAHKGEGELITECDETRPFWCKVKDLDYSRMWEDDKLWLPIALEGKKFEGFFLFDDLKLLDSRIVVEEDE